MKKRSWWILGLGFLGGVVGIFLNANRKIKTEEERNREILGKLERIPLNHITKVTIDKSTHEGQL
jgi:hypothetical protein